MIEDLILNIQSNLLQICSFGILFGLVAAVIVEAVRGARNKDYE